MNTASRGQLLESLRSRECPSCAGAKKSMHSLCVQCYRSLPADMRSALYRLIGDGYETALEAALRHLREHP